MIRRSLSLLGLAAFALATAGPALADASARISGRVLDAQTKTPLVAKLSVTDATGYTVDVKTDRNGQFSTVGMEPGRVTVAFFVPGFASQAVSCNVPAGETARFDFRAYTQIVSTHHAAYHCTLEPATQDRYTLQ